MASMVKLSAFDCRYSGCSDKDEKDGLHGSNIVPSCTQVA